MESGRVISILLLFGSFFCLSKKNYSQCLMKKREFHCFHVDTHLFLRSTETTCINQVISQSRSYYQANVNISNCNFQRFVQFVGDGGVIYIKGDLYYLFIENSVFFGCFCTKNGGGIHFHSNRVVFSKICAKLCSANYGHFGYIIAKEDNFHDHLSITSCSNVTNGYYSIEINSGNQKIQNVNSSMNKASQMSGIGNGNPASFSCSYCSFSHNNMSSGICIMMNGNTGTIFCSNIIHNICPTSFGIVYVYGSYLLKYCIFSNNHNVLFHISTGNLSIIHCLIFHSGAISTTYGLFASNNNSYISASTYFIHFYNSAYCNTDGILPIIETSKQIYRSLIFVFIHYLISEEDSFGVTLIGS